MREHEEEVERILARHAFFRDLDPEVIRMLASCARLVSYEAGQSIYQEGEAADQFFLLEKGKVAIQVFVTGRGKVTVQTVGANDILGWSWFYPPYRRRFDAMAIMPTKAVVLEGVCIRDKAEADPRAGYELLKRFSAIAVDRLHAMTMQLLDLYGKHV